MATVAQSLMRRPGGLQDMPWRSLRTAGTLALRKRADLTVEGSEFLPPSGPLIVAARHFHHLYDGCALHAAIPRPVHVVVALDWIDNTAVRLGMEKLCAAARWPAVIRDDPRRPGAARTPEAVRYLRRAVADSTRLLADGRVLIVFPEGYPNVDPGSTPKESDDAFLPFEPGFVRLAEIAQRSIGEPVPIVPAGFVYARGDRWRITLRFGEPVLLDRQGRRDETAALVERRVRELSA